MSLRDEVVIAFSKTPHPGDEALTSCDCDECRWEVARFRGKKWTRLSLEDFGAEDGEANVSSLTPSAFHYFLPGLILLAIDHPEVGDEMLRKIIGRFTVSDSHGDYARSRVEQVVKRLSGRQRQVLVDLFRQAKGSGLHVPAILDSAIATLLGGVATPFIMDDVDRWIIEKYGRASGLPGASGHRPA